MAFGLELLSSEESGKGVGDSDRNSVFAFFQPSSFSYPRVRCPSSNATRIPVYKDFDNIGNVFHVFF